VAVAVAVAVAVTVFMCVFFVLLLVTKNSMGFRLPNSTKKSHELFFSF
jgi:hypothetical protein